MAIDERKVRRVVLTELAKSGTRYVPAAISARHLHLCAGDVERLFGPGYQLTPLKALMQPGQFAAREQLTLAGPRGKLEKVRIIGPVRSQTQVEISLTDSLALGIKNCPVRMSGDIEQTPGIRIIGPRGEVELSQGVIAAKRHLHLSQEQAAAYQLHDGQVVSLRVTGPRPCIFCDVICRTGAGHELEFHVDTDEANACCLNNEELLEILPDGEVAAGSSGGCDTAAEPAQPEPVLDLVTEREVNEAGRAGKQVLLCGMRGLVTPLAYDRAGELGIRIERTSMKQKPKTVPQPVPGQKLLDLITEQDINDAYRNNLDTVFGTGRAVITEAARERAAACKIQMIRMEGGEPCR